MSQIKLPLRASLAAMLVCSAAACSKNEEKTTTSARAAETSGAITQTESLKATVQGVDAENRMLTLRDEQGRAFAVNVGDKVDMESIRPNDNVRVAYQESVAFALTDKDPSDAEGGPAVEQSARSIPDGVQFGRKISTTVEIVSVTPDGSHATFRAPEGGVRSVYVDDAPSQQKIAKMRPGDAVAVTYTEKLAVAVDRALDD